MVMKNSKKPTVIDIFCGCGGFSEGFRQAGFDVKLGIDIDKWAIATYNRNHRNKGMLANVENLSSSMIFNEIGTNQIDALIGGPPCQAFSSVAVAKWRSLGKPVTIHHPLNKLYKDLLRLIIEIKPKFFVIENVEGMMNIKEGLIKERIQSTLGGIFKISFYIKNVMHYGIPQNRKRIIIIGNRLNHDNPSLPETHGETSLGKKPLVTLQDAISDLPLLTHNGGVEYSSYNISTSLSTYAKQRRRYSNGIYNHTSRRHSERDLAIFKILNPGQSTIHLPELNPYRKDIFSDKYRKQPWDKPSSTILAHLSKDGLRFIHPDVKQNRTLTPREAARLQSFDDRYVFEGPRTHQFKQIGNAVPPLFAKFIAKHVLKIISEQSPAIESITLRS